jgi:hypothetical protein
MDDMFDAYCRECNRRESVHRLRHGQYRLKPSKDLMTNKSRTTMSEISETRDTRMSARARGPTRNEIHSFQSSTALLRPLHLNAICDVVSFYR